MAVTTPINTGYTIINGQTTGSNGAYVDTWIEYKVLSQSEENNTSTLRVILYAQATKSYGTAWTQSYQYGYVGYGNANKQYLTLSGYNFSNKALIKFADYTFTVAHSTDGTKSITLQGNWSGGTNTHTASTYISGGSVSGSVTLPAIIRASTFQIDSSATLGDTKTLTINKAQSTYTHTVRYTIGNTSTTVATKTTASSVSVSFPTSLAADIPGANSGNAIIYVDTYDGNTLKGTLSQTVVLNVPASWTPTISAIAIVEGGAYVPSSWHTFVTGKSSAKITVTATASQGATISSYSISAAGYTGTTNPYTTGIINGSGTIPVNVKVTDSRGRTAEAVSNIEVLDYSVPSISSVEIYRCNSQGTEDASGNYLSIKATATYNALNGHNTLALKVRSKLHSGSTWSGYTNLTNGVKSVLSGFYIANAYDLEIVAQDTFTNTTRAATVNSGDRILNISATGKSMGIGGFATGEENKLDIYWQTDFKSNPTVNGQPIGGGRTEETDPVFSASPAAGITSADIAKWNNNAFPKIARGSTTITSSNKTIDFPSGLFSSAPIVVASYSTTGTVAAGDWASIKISQITSSSFRIAFGGSGTATYPVEWIAIEP